MKIVIDAMGGDNAPSEIVKGAVEAKKEYPIEIILVGDEQKIKNVANENSLDLTEIEIINATEQITMEDDPATVVRQKKQSSMLVAMDILANGGADALVSAGNTGALFMGASLYVKRIKGIKRSALAPIIPNKDGKALLIDSGANVECTPEYLLQFAYMGSLYAELQMGIKNPRIGLCNIGTESTKGGELQRKTYDLLMKQKEEGKLNFVGNVEGRSLALGGADVFVCDGFTGNMMLKTYEGVGLFFLKELKTMFTSSMGGGIAALLIKQKMKDLKHRVDYKEVGGAPLLGIAKPVIKAHGSSDARAFKSAVNQAYTYAKSGIIEKLTESIKDMKI